MQQFTMLQRVPDIINNNRKKTTRSKRGKQIQHYQYVLRKHNKNELLNLDVICNISYDWFDI